MSGLKQLSSIEPADEYAARLSTALQSLLHLKGFKYLPGPGSAGLKVKQLHGYSDVLRSALGSLLDDWREGICSWTMHLYPTRGQWLPRRMRDTVRSTFLPLPFALRERWWVQILRPPKKFNTKNSVLRGMFLQTR